MSGVQMMAQRMAKALTEGPERIATTADYNAWLWGLAPAKVQELLGVEETRTVKLDDGSVFQLRDAFGGLLAAWRRHCESQGWQDRAFSEDTDHIRDELTKGLRKVIDNERLGKDAKEPGSIAGPVES